MTPNLGLVGRGGVEVRVVRGEHISNSIVVH